MRSGAQHERRRRPNHPTPARAGPRKRRPRTHRFTLFGSIQSGSFSGPRWLRFCCARHSALREPLMLVIMVLHTAGAPAAGFAMGTACAAVAVCLSLQPGKPPHQPVAWRGGCTHAHACAEEGAAASKRPGKNKMKEKRCRLEDGSTPTLPHVDANGHNNQQLRRLPV